MSGSDIVCDPTTESVNPWLDNTGAVIEKPVFTANAGRLDDASTGSVSVTVCGAVSVVTSWLIAATKAWNTRAMERRMDPAIVMLPLSST